MESLSASECPVCSRPLGYEQRVPYSLPCGHTLCHPCIKGLRKERHPFCPLCRSEVADIRNVKVNVTLYQLLQQLRSGTQFSRSLSINYEELELGQLLDRGASGEVYRGQWKGNDVAVKVFASGQLPPDAYESFRREVCVMSCLRHPNVVMLMASCQTPPRLMIVMEYVGGGSLYRLLHIQQTVLQADQIAKVTMDICRGLQYLHSINILHRDLKSKNVLLTGAPPNCQAKLCDFGLARMRLESATMTGNVGTVHWTAPEVLNCQRYQFPADIYGLGMLLYEMVSNQIPFASLLPPAVIVAVLIRKEKPHPPEQCHPVFSKLIQDCTSYEPTDRPGVGRVLEQLGPLLRKESPNDSTDLEITHTDSLGHVLLDFDSTEDSYLLELLAESDDESDEGENKEREEQQQQMWESESAGVLSHQELEELHKTLPPANYVEPLKPPAPSELFSKNAHGGKAPPMKQVSLPPANYVEPLKPPAPGKLFSKNARARKASPMKQRPSADSSPDFHLAMALQSAEQKKQLKKDYIMASQLQEQEQQLQRQEFIHLNQIQRERLNFISIPPPPPPPILNSQPLDQFTVRRAHHHMLVARIKGGSIRSKLKHVEPVEKRAFRVGRVVGGSSSKAAAYSTQNQILNFNKKWLFHVDLKEPMPAFPVGRVLAFPSVRVKPLIVRMNSEVRHFDKSKMHPVNTVIKNPLPTVQDIEKEKAEEKLDHPEFIVLKK